MTIIKGSTFTGEIPKAPPHLLPENAAQFAKNCAFGHGELRPLMLPGIVNNNVSSPWSIYTEEGKKFYSWGRVVFAVNGPIINDKYNRFYFTDDKQGGGSDGDGPYVEQYNPPTNGGEPSKNYLVGVPPPGSGSSPNQPNWAPGGGGPWAPAKLTLSTVNDPLLPYPPGVTDADMSIHFFYESGGERFQFTPDIGIPPNHIFGPRKENDPFQEYEIYIPPMVNVPAAIDTAVFALRVLERDQKNAGGNIGPLDVVVNANIKALTTMTVQVVGTQTLYSCQPGHFLSFTDSTGNEIYVEDFIAERAVTQGTPLDSQPCVEMTMIDMTGRTPPGTGTGGKNAMLWHNYSSNSVSAIKSGPQVTMTKMEDAPYHYKIKVTYPVAETRAYIYTLINYFGEESAPSEAALISVTNFDTVLVKTIFQNQPNYREQVAAKIYRSTTGTQGVTTYNFVGWMTLKTGVYDANGNIDNSHAHEPGGGPGVISTYPNEFYLHDTVLGSALGEECPSFGWTLPPSDLNQIIALPNGVLAAWKGHELYLSEPYRPHAWPIEYIMQFPYNIVGHIAHGGSIVVTTIAYPFIVNGIHPESMTSTKLPILQAGVSKRGMVDMGPAIAYVAPDGICVVSGGAGGINSSQQLFTREDWRKRYDSGNPSLNNMMLGVYDGGLLAFFSTSDGFMIRLDEGEGSYTRHDTHAVGTFLLPQTDQFYIGVGNTIQSFAEGSVPSLLTWRSKDFIIPRPQNFGVIQVVGAAHPLQPITTVEVTVTADGVDRIIGTITHNSQTPLKTTLRMPSGFLARRWSVQFKGTSIIKEWAMASIPRELASV